MNNYIKRKHTYEKHSVNICKFYHNNRMTIPLDDSVDRYFREVWYNALHQFEIWLLSNI